MKQSNLNEFNHFLAHKDHLQNMFEDPIEWYKRTILRSYFL